MIHCRGTAPPSLYAVLFTRFFLAGQTPTGANPSTILALNQSGGAYPGRTEPYKLRPLGRKRKLVRLLCNPSGLSSWQGFFACGFRIYSCISVPRLRDDRTTAHRKPQATAMKRCRRAARGRTAVRGKLFSLPQLTVRFASLVSRLTARRERARGRRRRRGCWHRARAMAGSSYIYLCFLSFFLFEDE